jgi:predicted phage replisome organizer
MADNQKYYYMRLKEDFFDSDSILLLESMQDGYLFSNILLKLYLRSLKDSGRLMLNGRIPYNPQMIATVTRHQVGTVEKALRVFADLGLIEILDNGAIYMADIQNYIGKSTTEADRKRQYREKITAEKNALQLPEGQKADKCPDKSTPEIEIEIEIEPEIKIEKKSKGKAARFTPPTLEELQQYIAENGFTVDAAYFFDYYTANGWIAGKNKMKDWRATVRNWNRRENKKPQQQKKIAYDTSTELPF